MSTTNGSSYDSLLAHIGEALESGRKKAASRINEAIVETYWIIGKYIVDFEQAGNEKGRVRLGDTEKAFKRPDTPLWKRVRAEQRNQDAQALSGVPNFADTVCKIELEPLC